jgi:DNA polymerase-4
VDGRVQQPLPDHEALKFRIFRFQRETAENANTKAQSFRGFTYNTSSPRDLTEGSLRDLAAQVGRRLRRADLAKATVKIKIRWPDFTTLTRQVTLAQPTDQDEEIAVTALDLLAKVRPKGKAVRLIGVGVTGLGAPLRQLELWGT